MTTYHFRLDRFHIFNTRALHEDTDVVSFGVKVGNSMLPPQIKHMGNVNNGDHSVDLKIGPVQINDDDTPVIITYQIINSGHRDQATLDSVLTTGTSEIAASQLASGDIPGAIAAEIVSGLASLFTADCDGLVVVDRIALTGARLKRITTAHNPFTLTRIYHGTDSATGCGSNSVYNVTWVVFHE